MFHEYKGYKQTTVNSTTHNSLNDLGFRNCEIVLAERAKVLTEKEIEFIVIEFILFSYSNGVMASAVAPNYVIFDTDMGNDDAWALQMILKAEKQYKKIKVIAITIVDGNTDTENAAKNTYRLLDGLDRTDVGCILKKVLNFIFPKYTVKLDSNSQRSI